MLQSNQQWPRSDPTMSAAGVTLVGAAVKRPRDPGSTQTSFSLGEYYKEGQRPVSLFLLSSFTHYYSATKEEGQGQVSTRFLEIQHNSQPLKKCFSFIAKMESWVWTEAITCTWGKHDRCECKLLQYFQGLYYFSGKGHVSLYILFFFQSSEAYYRHVS